jgi:hypothetical protein
VEAQAFELHPLFEVHLLVEVPHDLVYIYRLLV